MTGPQVVEAELRAIIGECVGHLRLISEAAGPLACDATKQLINEAQRSLEVAFALADRLP